MRKNMFAVHMAAIAALLAVAAPVPAAAAQGGPGFAARSAHADREFMIGRWTDTGDCADSVQFDADGHFVASDGGEGEWTMQGDRLTLAGASVLTVRVVAIDRDTIDVIGPDGQSGRSTRCDNEFNDAASFARIVA